VLPRRPPLQETGAPLVRFPCKAPTSRAGCLSQRGQPLQVRRRTRLVSCNDEEVHNEYGRSARRGDTRGSTTLRQLSCSYHQPSPPLTSTCHLPDSQTQDRRHSPPARNAHLPGTRTKARPLAIRTRHLVFKLTKRCSVSIRLLACLDTLTSPTSTVGVHRRTTYTDILRSSSPDAHINFTKCSFPGSLTLTINTITQDQHHPEPISVRSPRSSPLSRSKHPTCSKPRCPAARPPIPLVSELHDTPLSCTPAPSSLADSGLGGTHPSHLLATGPHRGH
jgi:hypothetical protein